MIVEKNENILMQCDTGEINCFACIGRENCDKYATLVPINDVSSGGQTQSVEQAICKLKTHKLINESKEESILWMPPGYTLLKISDFFDVKRLVGANITFEDEYHEWILQPIQLKNGRPYIEWKKFHQRKYIYLDELFMDCYFQLKAFNLKNELEDFTADNLRTVKYDIINIFDKESFFYYKPCIYLDSLFYKERLINEDASVVLETIDDLETGYLENKCVIFRRKDEKEPTMVGKLNKDGKLVYNESILQEAKSFLLRKNNELYFYSKTNEMFIIDAIFDDESITYIRPYVW